MLRKVDSLLMKPHLLLDFCTKSENISNRTFVLNRKIDCKKNHSGRKKEKVGTRIRQKLWRIKKYLGLGLLFLIVNQVKISIQFKFSSENLSTLTNVMMY